jgi:hypothetical protein
MAELNVHFDPNQPKVSQHTRLKGVHHNELVRVAHPTLEGQTMLISRADYNANRDKYERVDAAPKKKKRKKKQIKSAE